MSDKAEPVTINVHRMKGGRKIVQADKGADLTEDQLYQAVRVGEQMHKADEFLKKGNMEKALSYYKLAAKAGDLTAQLKVAELLEKYVLSKPFPSKIKEKTPLSDFIHNLAQAGKQKNKEAQFRLAMLFYRGDFGQDKNLESAYKWFEVAAADGTHALSVFYQGYCLLKSLGIAEDVPRAITLLQQASAMNCIDATFQLAECYEKGIGFTQDPKQGFLLYQKALKLAENDKETEPPVLAKIRANIARCYARGIGVDQDEKKAVKEMNLIEGVDLPNMTWTIGTLNELVQADSDSEAIAFTKYKAAADQGHIEAMMKVAQAYLDGRGTTADVKKAMEYFDKAAKRDHPPALLHAGKQYLAGFGVKKDHKIAIKYFKKAFHEFHYEPAMYYLGLCYVLFGTKEEQVSGFVLLNSVASSGDLAARFRMGWCYMLGRGVEKNSSQAIEIFENCLAADPESIDYMNMLATALMFSKPRLQDRHRAFELLTTAESLFQNDMLVSDETYQMLARCHRFGYGTVQDDQKAIAYLKRSAALGNNSSKVMLALCHFHGIGVPKNSEQAITLLKEMVILNCTEALTCWGVFALTGWGGEKPNAKKAFNLFKQATSADVLHHESDSINNHGWCYLQGLGTEQDYALAIKSFEEARARGNRCAINNLAWCYLNGFGVTKDIAKAKTLFLEARDIPEEENLANTFGMSYLGYWSVESEIRRLEQSKDPAVLYNLALCYLNGFGVRQNERTGVEILTTLTKESHYPPAMLKLGICYLRGMGLEDQEQSSDNDKKAFELFCAVANHDLKAVNKPAEQEMKIRKEVDSDSDDEQAVVSEKSLTSPAIPAKEGSDTTVIDYKIHAYVNLALCQINGRGISKNLERGFRLLETCSAMGDPEAQFHLGRLYASGQVPNQLGVPDKKQAFEWFNKAAIHGYPPAQRFIASYYEKGQGVPRDLKQAFEQYQLAAAQGDAISENNLGILYETGAGTTQNTALAFQSYERSAQRGDFVLGWYHLGRCYEMGIGTNINLLKAQACYREASLRGHQRSEQILANLLISETKKSAETKTMVEQNVVIRKEDATLDRLHEDREQKAQSEIVNTNPVLQGVVILDKKPMKSAITLCEPIADEATINSDQDALKKLSLNISSPLLREVLRKNPSETTEATFLPLRTLQQQKKVAKVASAKQDLQVNGRILKQVDLRTAFHTQNNLAFLR